MEVFAEVRAERAAKQGDLFSDEAENLPEVVAPLAADGTRRGRRPGARGRRTDELARWYIQRNDGRDPLERGIEISGLPILARGVLEGLAERLGCTRYEAAKFWAGILASTLPFVHQRQAALEVRPNGAPGSNQPILWEMTDDGQLIDISHGDGEETLTPLAPPPSCVGTCPPRSTRNEQAS